MGLPWFRFIIGIHDHPSHHSQPAPIYLHMATSQPGGCWVYRERLEDDLGAYGPSTSLSASAAHGAASGPSGGLPG